MNVCDGLGLKRDDCFEKTDLIKRIEEYLETKKQKKANNAANNFTEKEKPAQNAAFSNTQQSSAFTPSSDFSYMPENDTVSFKIVSIGNQEVGKSCLIKRYCEGKFVKRYISTIGVDYGVRKLNLKNHPISINFFDLSGYEDYKLIRTEFYEDTSGLLMVYDVDNKDSFASLVHWEDEAKRGGVDLSRVKVVVAGNKSDSKGREVQMKDAAAWAKKRNYGFFETSALSAQNVNECFEALFGLCLDQYLEDKKKFGFKK